MCSTSTSRDSVIANRRAFSATELQLMIGTITIGSLQTLNLQIAGCRDFLFNSLIVASDREHQGDRDGTSITTIQPWEYFWPSPRRRAVWLRIDGSAMSAAREPAWR
jgi:hypothetical protein